MKPILILAVMYTNKIEASGAQKTHTHILKSQRTLNESLFGADFGPEAKLSHFSSKLSKKKPLQSMAIVIEPCWTNFFFSKKLKRRILATFGFNNTALRTTQPKLHSMFSAFVFEDRIISLRADVVWLPRSCDLTPLDYYLWCYAHKPETIDAFKNNIREAIGEIQLHTIDNVFNLIGRIV